MSFMAFDDRDLTAHEKEQLIFSDMQLDVNSGKDFKQIALKNHQDQINGVDQEKADKEFQDFASNIEYANQLLDEQREKFMHKLYGYEVSETNVRKAATNILRDYDTFAERFGLEGDEKDIVYDQILFLQTGTAEEQDQALKDLHERNPNLAEAIVEEAHDIKIEGHKFDTDADTNLTSSAEQTFTEQQHSFQDFGLNQNF